MIKQNVTHFSSIISKQNFLLCPWKTLIYCCQVVQISPHRISAGLSKKVAHQCPPYPRLCLFPSLISIRTKQAYTKANDSRIYRYRNAVSLQIFTRNVKKEKVALSISRNKRIVNKYSNENSNKEERYDWIRILNKLRWLKMQVMLTFFYLKQLFEIFICNLLSTFSSFQCLYIVRFEFFLVHMMDQISMDTPCDLTEKVLLRF